jgi:Family of unknown function (DUF5996)
VNLPELHIAGWRPTKDTLHLYAQIVGKVRLATTPPRNHWWHAPLYVNVRGLTTGPMRRGLTTFEIAFDFVDHELVVRTMSGLTRTFSLQEGLSVADFDARLHAALAELGVDVVIKEQPFGVPMTTPFDQDTEHASWDRDAIQRFHRALDWSSSVLEEFSGWFAGKTSPVQLFWQSLDLSLTRFSGRPGISAKDLVNREAYTHEVMLFGFWMGDEQTFPDASYYAFMVPEPKGWRSADVVGGQWTSIGLTVLPYETVRSARDPRKLLLAFLQSSYEAAAGLASWDLAALQSAWCPTAEQLRQLRSVAITG